MVLSRLLLQNFEASRLLAVVGTDKVSVGANPTCPLQHDLFHLGALGQLELVRRLHLLTDQGPL